MSRPPRPFRLFLGVPIHGPLVNTLAALRFRSNIRWQEPETYHITLRYLGAYKAEDDARELIPDIHTVLDTLSAAPVESRITGIGIFENAAALYADVELTPSLKQLHKLLAEACYPIGPPEQFPEYHPHVTLGKYRRWDPPTTQQRGNRTSKLMASKPLGITAHRLKLIMTVLREHEEMPGFYTEQVELGVWPLNAVPANA